MKITLFITTMLFMLFGSLYCQHAQSEIEYMDSILILEYPITTKKIDVDRLDTIQSKQLDIIRFWSDVQIITLTKSSKNVYSGYVVNYIKHFKHLDAEKKNITEKAISNIEASRVKYDYHKAIELGLIDLPTESEIEGWNWVTIDGKTYIIESLIQGNYKIRIYNSPESLHDSIAYKNEIGKLVNYFNQGYKNYFNTFFNRLPNGAYKIANKIHLKTNHNSSKHK